MRANQTWRFLIIGLVLAAVAFAGRASFERGIDSYQRQAAARRYLEMNRLPQTEEYVRLYEAFISPVTSVDPLICREHPDDALLAGVKTLAIYLQPPVSWPQFAAEAEVLTRRASAIGIHLRLLHNREEFFDALLHDDIVFFSGHANFGRGIMLVDDDQGNEVLVPVPEANPAIPGSALQPNEVVLETLDRGMVRIHTPADEKFPLKISCRLFIHMGCRTDFYYRDALTRQFPDTAFVLTSYTWGPHLRIIDAIDTLLSGLEQSCDLSVVLSQWERLFQDVELQGRMIERDIHKNLGPYPSRIFVQHAPHQNKMKQ